MSKTIKPLLSLLLCLIFTANAYAFNTFTLVPTRTDSITLDARFFVTMSNLKSISERLKASVPIHIENSCKEEHCVLLAPYERKLANLHEDLREYQSYLYYSIYASQGSFQSYIEQTITNEDLKNRLQNRLILKDGIAQFASLMADVASVYGAIKAGSGPVAGKTLDLLMRLVQDADVILTIINNVVKSVKSDGGTDLISEGTGDENWSNLYSALKTPLDLLASYKDFKALRALPGSDFDGYSNARAGVGAILVQLLGIWASNERQRMKKSIKELDDLLAPNQKAYGEHYQRMVLKRRIYDYIDTMRSKIGKQFGAFTCSVNHMSDLRDTRESFKKDKANFGLGLKYYKGKVEAYKGDTGLTWTDPLFCGEDNYQFVVHDGMGKEFPAEMQITRRYKYKESFEGIANSTTVFKLYTGSYNIEILEDETKDKVLIAPLKITDFKITGKEERIFKLDPTGRDSIRRVTLHPYGRVALEVVTKEGKPHDFGYEFIRYYTERSEQFQEEVLKGARYNKILIDLPAKDPLDLFLSFGFDHETTKGLKITPNKTLKLRYVYDDKKFVREEVAPKTIEPEVTLKNKAAPDPVEIKTVPKGWVRGTLYNSNDGTCEHQGKTLYFWNFQGGQYKNLTTGVISEVVSVPPGQKLAVAAPSKSSFMRVFTGNPKNSNSGAERISFASLADLSEGWWYSSGCEDGTRPVNPCDNGKGQGARGGSCETLGD